MTLNRREAMKVGLAELLGAMLPFRVKARAEPAPVKDGMLFHRGEFETYAVTKGILWTPGLPAFLFQDLGMTVYTPKDPVTGRNGRVKVSATFGRVIGPLWAYCKAVHHWGDAVKQSKLPLHVGLLRENVAGSDDAHLWFTVKRPVLTQIGTTVAAGKDGSNGEPAMAAGELLCFQGFDEPEVRKTPPDGLADEGRADHRRGDEAVHPDVAQLVGVRASGHGA